MLVRQKITWAVVACVVAAGHSYAFSPSLSVGKSLNHVSLRSARAGSSCLLAAQGTMAMQANGANRRDFLRTAGAATFLPAILAWGAAPSHAEEDLMPGIAVKVLEQIAGGSQQELDAFAAAPSKPLEGYDAQIYKVYKYAATKCPAAEDPRASLRGLFTSKVADGVFKYVQEDLGVNSKIYDARGDGLTNNGKGGAVKGVTALLAGLKKKGLIKDFTVDSSAHDENKWLQGSPSSITVTVTEPVGLQAAQLLTEEKIGLPLSIASSTMQGYFKQVKLFTAYEQSYEGNVETLKVALSWAGKDRQKNTLDRRSKDKLNAARAYTKE